MAVKIIKYELARAIPSGNDITAKNAVLTAAVVAAQAIGAGDASVEIDAVDAAAVAALAAIATGVTIIVETTCTQNQFQRILEDALKRLP